MSEARERSALEVLRRLDDLAKEGHTVVMGPQDLTDPLWDDIEAVLRATPVADSYWWCPECREVVDASRVTYQELHDTCGTRVETRATPASDGGEVRGAIADADTEFCDMCLGYFDPEAPGAQFGNRRDDDGLPAWSRCPRCARAFDAGYQQGQSDPRPALLSGTPQGEGERWEREYETISKLHEQADEDNAMLSARYYRGYMDGMIAARAAYATEDRRAALLRTPSGEGEASRRLLWEAARILGEIGGALEGPHDSVDWGVLRTDLRRFRRRLTAAALRSEAQGEAKAVRDVGYMLGTLQAAERMFDCGVGVHAAELVDELMDGFGGDRVRGLAHEQSVEIDWEEVNRIRAARRGEGGGE